MPLCRLGTHPAPSLLPVAAGTAEELEQTPGKGLEGVYRSGGLFPDLFEAQQQTGGAPVTASASDQQQRPWFRAPSTRNSLCATAVTGSHEGQTLLAAITPKQSGFSAPPTPKWASPCCEDLESSTAQKATAKTLPCRRGKSRWILLCLVHH